jgi:hypothetical protein
MWEAKGDADGLIAWLRADVLPTLDDDLTAELFRSADRVVVILRSAAPADTTPADTTAADTATVGTAPADPAQLRLPDPPAHLVARPPHAWPFEAVAI